MMSLVTAVIMPVKILTYIHTNLIFVEKLQNILKEEYLNMVQYLYFTVLWCLQNWMV